MPVPVFLDFIPPNDIPDLTELHILEGPTVSGPFSEIEVVTSIGTAGNYISSHTTPNALSNTDWFVIQWKNAAGVFTPTSAAVKGGTRSLVAEIVSRAMLRDATINEEVAVQEAEAAISDYYNTIDPYSINVLTVSPKIKSGLTNLTLARSYITKAITTSNKNKWVAGLVSLDNSSGSAGISTQTVQALIDLANKDLGRSLSFKLLLEEVEVAGGFKQIVAADLSRTIIEIA
jgi:hypothetical protein